MVSKVAALINDILTPLSGAPKSDRPTVKGRVLSELLTTKGHRKLFQCVDTDTSAYARYTGFARGT